MAEPLAAGAVQVSTTSPGFEPAVAVGVPTAAGAVAACATTGIATVETGPVPAALIGEILKL